MTRDEAADLEIGAWVVAKGGNPHDPVPAGTIGKIVRITGVDGDGDLRVLWMNPAHNDQAYGPDRLLTENAWVFYPAAYVDVFDPADVFGSIEKINSYLEDS